MTQPGPADPDDSIAELVKRVGDDTIRLVRGEVALAKAELAGKARTAGVGAGLLGAAGMFGWFGLAVLVAAAVLGLATVVPAWLAALIVGGALLLVALAAAVAGAARLRRVQPVIPAQSVDSVRDDVAAIREAVHR